MRSVSRATRVTAAVSLVLTAVFSAIAAIGFSGHASATGTTGTSGKASVGPSSDARVALPPRGDGATLAPPVTAPVSQQAPAPVTSGGS
jgi:hypothetical protein